jgi:hypothetical protein
MSRDGRHSFQTPLVVLGRDIEPDQVAGLAMPGMRLQRLVSYRRGAQADRRFAAFYYDDDGATHPRASPSPGSGPTGLLGRYMSTSMPTT